MNGPIAQIVALTCHGNAFIQGYEVNEFFPKNSTCTFCERVVFVNLHKSLLGKWKEKEIAKTPNEWFRVISLNGAKGIRLLQTPTNDPNIRDRMSAGFVGGGGTWLMEVAYEGKRSQFWVPRWEVWNRETPDRRIWRVAYGSFSEKGTIDDKSINLQAVEQHLSKALHEIYTFSKKQDCGGFTQCFEDALDILVSKGKDLSGYHKDLGPEGYLSDQAQILLHACQKSWVFGGMGSWNDMGFDGSDQDEYERVSEQLFTVLIRAIVIATNSTYTGNGEGHFA